MFSPVSRKTVIIFEDEETGKLYKIESEYDSVTVFEESTYSSDGFIGPSWVKCRDLQKVSNLTFAFENETK